MADLLESNSSTDYFVDQRANEIVSESLYTLDPLLIMLQEENEYTDAYILASEV